MAKVNFTAARVAAFECEPGKSQSIHRDAVQPGLCLRVTRAGERAYVYEQKLNGKTVRITIGSPAAWPLEKARTEAARLRVLIDSGRDPRDERRQQAADDTARLDEAKRATVTLEQAWAAYIEARKPQWSKRSYNDHLALAHAGGIEKKRGEGETKPAPLASLMPLKLTELTPNLIGAWLANEAAVRPESARMAFNRLKIFAKWCELKAGYAGLIDVNAVDTGLAKSNLPKQKPKKDVLQREQLAAWFAAVQQLGNPVMSTYLIGLLLTGARREELAALRWGDVDFQWRSLTIGDKVNGTRVIPMTPYVRSLLLELKRLNDTPPNIRQLREQFADKPWQPSEFVFSSKTSSKGRLTSPTRALNRTCQIAGVPHVSLHGLRRSFGSLAEWTDLPAGISAQIMGHAPSAIAEKHYRVRPLDLLRQHADKFEQWLLNEAGIGFQPAAEQKAPMLKAV